MKKILLFVSAVILSASCSSDDNEINNSSNSKITPPEWIQGTWLQDNSYKLGYKFTTNDFCQILPTTEYCWKSVVELTNSVTPSDNNKSSISQESSATVYSITLNIYGAQKTILSFRKKSNNEIIWSNAPGFTEEQLELFTYKKQ